MRFDFGTVAAVRPPAQVDLRLTEFDDWRDVSFRVKVTDVTDSPGRILALGDKIRPKGPEDDRRNDLVRWKDAELDGRLWDMEFDEQGPVVLIEKTVGHATVGQDGRFVAAAYPEILRRTLQHVLLSEEQPVDDSEHWFAAWRKSFFIGTLGLPPVPEDAANLAARRDWIEKAVIEFGMKHGFGDRWAEATGIKGDE